MASGPGNRKVAEVNNVPSRIRCVSRARPARVSHASVGPGRPSPPIAWKWSERKNASKPSSSVARATRSRSSYDAPCWGSVNTRSCTRPAWCSRRMSAYGGVMTTESRELASAAVAYAKPRLRGWLHLVTSPLALASGLVLIVLAPTATATAAAAAYAATAVVLFTTSAIYHRGNWSPRVEEWLKRLDHANIFLLIAGTYTPFAVLALRGDTRVAVLATVWSLAVLGALFRVLWVQAPRWLYTPMYIGLGWAAAFVVPQLLHGEGVTAFILMSVGGFCYTAGGVVYALRRPNPSPRWFGFHEVFHALTVAGFVCQYIAASFVVYRAA